MEENKKALTDEQTKRVSGGNGWNEADCGKTNPELIPGPNSRLVCKDSSTCGYLSCMYHA